ncbi:MAG: proline dehydrogenase family protein [Candidatus Delongbacteria bacterium]
MSAFNNLVANTLPYFPKKLVGHLSRHYISGEQLDDAVRVGRELMAEGCCLTLDVLGEHVQRPEETHAYAKLYLQVVERIARDGLDANVSVKPTQMGLALDPALCRANYRAILEQVDRQGSFLRIDMEDTPFTDATLDLHDELRAQFPGRVGVVIQAYLRRTLPDIEQRLIPAGTHLRLCKGIYKEPVELAYHGYQEIRDNYLRCLEALLEAGNYVGIATHDRFLVEGALKIIKRLKLTPDRYEFQMLLGVLPGLRREIVGQGHKLRVYVPFGEAWFAYSTRRLKENPDLVMHFVKDFFRKH